MTPQERFERNQALVPWTIKKMRLAGRIPPHAEEDDLMQVGLLGLWNAANGFKAEKGYTFSTYAATAIRNKIGQHLQMRPGRKQGWYKETGQIAEVGSLNQPIRHGDSVVELGDTLAQPDLTEEQALAKARMAEFWAAVAKLPERQREVVQMIFGEDETPTTASIRLGVSKQAIYQALSRSRSRLSALLGEELTLIAA